MIVQDGVLRTHSADVAAAVSRVVASHMNSIIAATVSDPRWCRSPRLQLRRVKVCSLLVGASDGFGCEQLLGRPLSLPAALHGGPLFAYVFQVFQAVLAPATMPSR